MRFPALSAALGYSVLLAAVACAPQAAAPTSGPSPTLTRTPVATEPAGAGSPAAATPTPGVPPATGTPAGPSARAQIAAGHAVYQEWCAACHGPEGEGQIGPRLIGPGNGLAKYGTAQGLYDYIVTAMPQNAPGSLSDEQYWNVVAYLLARNDLLDQNRPLGPSNASEVRLSR